MKNITLMQLLTITMFEKLTKPALLAKTGRQRLQKPEPNMTRWTRMPQKDCCSKKIASEEEQKNFVLVLKDRLAFFPEEGETFKLIHNGQPRKAKIESYPCSCRGPDQPHSHYFVKSKGLRAGDR